MKKIALALCAASALFGANAYNYEFTPVVGYAHPEGTQGIDDQKFIGLRIARNLDMFLLSQLELGFDYSKNVTFENLSGKDTDLTRYYINLIKDFPLTDVFSVYGLLGLGYQDLTHEANDIEDGGFAQAGLGLKYKVTDNFALKAEARDALDWNHGSNTFLYSLGFAVSFGEVAKAAPAPVVEEKAAPAPAPIAPAIGDEDGDGVFDNVDRCYGTPKGVVVDEYGCEKVIRLSLKANFAFDSATVSPEYEAKIKEVANVMVDHPEYRIILEGHTDSTGSDVYNQKLSLKRANAVASVLEKMGVSKSKITTEGFGESKPVASNATKEGRAENRRVEAKFRNK
ncbi:OmpA family protein [Campylobacter hyointestinalis]|uniref:OmpA family protein n=1 Tax=Campylobacter hyointestinalis TaxID=198 RepID=UPI0004D8349D|nr:OmpA family protein [Campylobacter hyointestinalis]ANE33031.1 outer membrane fibronectin-binding protein [Campylobacter hyointestinalis subsp. hyointestinalis LMG 9260]KEA43805.1 flagellar motor protein MotB [Campylobacter hyointestinalis subsp. hyointestinalis]MBT0612063.1 OmpA family protein [Campylobacter hyointestinalis subsp. hyointestinalis]MDL2346514.1 OmpA family protein [Campylobacter hyointestinalis]MDL2348253.1 OmpA family protein [Campylobacter hyointestinalis]